MSYRPSSMQQGKCVDMGGHRLYWFWGPKGCGLSCGDFQELRCDTIKNFTFAVSFRGISRTGCDFIFLPWFNLAQSYIQVTSLYTGEEFEWISKFLIGNWFQVTLPIASGTTCKQRLRVKLWKAKARTEKANKLNTKSESEHKYDKEITWKYVYPKYMLPLQDWKYLKPTVEQRNSLVVHKSSHVWCVFILCYIAMFSISLGCSNPLRKGRSGNIQANSSSPFLGDTWGVRALYQAADLWPSCRHRQTCWREISGDEFYPKPALVAGLTSRRLTDFIWRGSWSKRNLSRPEELWI